MWKVLDMQSGALVRCYLDYCRKSLQMKIHPKLHILEKHVVPWLHTINMGLGPVSEHGVGPPSIQHSVPKGRLIEDFQV